MVSLMDQLGMNRESKERGSFCGHCSCLLFGIKQKLDIVRYPCLTVLALCK